jgi:hypothetical protein
MKEYRGVDVEIHPLDRRLGEPQSRSGRYGEGTILDLYIQKRQSYPYNRSWRPEEF